MLLPFIQACNSGGLSETERYKYSILTFSANNMDKQADDVHTEFAKSFEENKHKVGPIKDKADSVKIRSIELADLCRKIFEKDTLGESSADLKTDFLEKLPLFRNYTQKCAENIKKDTAIYNLWKRTSDFSLVEFDKLYKLDWILMRGKIKSIDLMTIKLLYSQVDTESFKSNVVKIVVVPESRYVKSGDYYRAEIYPILYDSTKNFKYVIDKDTFTAEKGIGKYTAPPATQLGKFKKEGSLILQNPYTDGILSYPFTIEYEVVK